MKPTRTWIWLAGALAVGGLIMWIDSRPNWDDTGVTAGLLVLSAAGLGWLRPRLAWLGALAVGAWIPLRALILQGNASLVLILLLPLAGAYAGALARRLVNGPVQRPQP